MTVASAKIVGRRLVKMMPMRLSNTICLSPEIVGGSNCGGVDSSLIILRGEGEINRNDADGCLPNWKVTLPLCGRRRQSLREKLKDVSGKTFVVVTKGRNPALNRIELSSSS